MSNSRTITLYATKGKKSAKIESSATTWGELRAEVSNAGYDVNSLLATESVNRTDLNHKDAKIPESNFILFMRPKKTKSGVDADSMSYKECKTFIKETIASDGESAKEHFCSKYGKNYTHMSTSDLRTAINEYKPAKQSVSTDVEEAEEVSENNVADVVESVKGSKQLTPSEKIDAAIELLKEVCTETEDTDVCERTDESIQDLEALKEDVEAWENPEASAERKAEEERIRKEQEEQEELERMANEIENGRI